MADWRKLFPKAMNHALDFYPPSLLEDGAAIVEPPPEVFEEASEWLHSIVAQFLSKPPNFSTLQRTVTKLWEKQDNITIIIAGPNLFTFKCENEKACNWILEHGPWHIQHNTMILKTFSISNLDALTNLPRWLLEGSASTLQQIRIEDCDSLVVLPEWLQKFTSLHKLEIIGCKQLSALLEGMDCLTGLKQLIIRKCPKLSSRYRRDGDTDWHKIAHIQEVVITDY